MFGLEGRGELRAGNHADVIVFDPARFAPRADYIHPTLLGTGMVTVLVNGQLAIDDGQPTGIAAGTALPHRSTAQACDKLP